MLQQTVIRIDIKEDKRLLEEFRPFDTPVESTKLPFGDLAFAGNGPDDDPVMIGFERKTIRNLVSDIRNKHLAGFQLVGMLETYPHAAYLLVEGIWRPGHGGEVSVPVGKEWIPLDVGNQPISYREVDHFLATMEECGLRVYRTPTMAETAAYIVSRYKWWNDKEYAEHKAHRSIYAPAPEYSPNKGRVSFRPERPNKVVRVAAQMDGVDSKAWKIRDVFKTPGEMALGTEEQWKKALGLKEGAKTVRKMIDWWWEE